MADLVTPLNAWFSSHARELPWRHPEFGAWGILVSEFMLQQTPVTRVIPLLEAWLERWPTPTDLANSAPAEAVQQWANLGYPRRALWLHRAAVQLRDNHSGAVPTDVDQLLALTGIGDYTARAVAVFAFGQRHPVVDTNTRRVLARAVDGRSQPGPPTKSDLADMEQQLPQGVAASAVFNAAAMELGAVICTARAPRCGECPISDRCAWLGAGSPDTGDARRKQARYEGSDRQARGAILQVLRASSGFESPLESIIASWPDELQRDRAIDSLITDGLAEIEDGMLRLPR